MTTRRPRIAISTTTRAEFGLLATLARTIQMRNKMDCAFWVSGTHLEPSFGMTVQEIEASGFPIGAKLKTWTSESNGKMLAATIAAVDQQIRTHERPDLLIVLGDRFETLGVALASHLNLIPIAHLHGGEVSEGAIDEECRHAITKLSTRHYCASSLSARRIIQMGEEPESVKNVGALGIENILHQEVLDRSTTLRQLGLKDDQRYILCTLHPETKNPQSSDTQFQVLNRALNTMKNHSIVWTYPNADHGHEQIVVGLQSLENNSKYKIRKSLGQALYINALKHADLCIGNSSSGLFEAPALETPCINLGDRQLNREHGSPVLHVPFEFDAILSSLQSALSLKKNALTKYSHPFGKGDTSSLIADDLQAWLLGDSKATSRGKSFQLLDCKADRAKE